MTDFTRVKALAFDYYGTIADKLSLAGEIEGIGKQIDQNTVSMEEKEAALYRQFVALERVANQSKAQLSLLNRQFGSGGGGGDQ